MATTAQVDIILNGKATGLSATIRGVKGEILSFSNTLKAGFGFSIGEKLASGVLGVGSAIKAGIDGATQFASQLQDLSTAAGLGVEPFQVLARSAKLSGAQMEDVSKGIVSIGEKTREALSGSGSAADAFKTLGINAKEFADLAPERQIEMIGKAYAEAKDPGEAFHAVMELLGAKTAPKLRAMLAELGEQGLDKLFAAMAKAGLVMREDLVHSLDDAGDAADDNAKRFTIAWGGVAKALQPAFSGLHKLGEWAADVLSWVLLRLEKISIAAGSIAAMIVDIVTGDYKGLDFYQDTAEKLAKEAQDRHDKKKTTPMVGTPATPGAGAAMAENKAAAYEMKQIADDVEKAQQRASLDLGRIARDFNLTDAQRKDATTAILQKQSDKIFDDIQRLNQLIVQLAKADPGFEKYKKNSPGLSDFQVARGLSQGPDGNKQLAGAFEQRDKLVTAQTNIQEHNFDVHKDPQTVMEGVGKGLTDIETRWGSLAQQISSSVVSIGDALTGSLGGAMNQLLGTTEYWSQSLGTIAGPVMGAVTQAISKMFAEWIVGRLAAMAKNVAASAAETAASLPTALLASVSSFGTAAALGIAGFLLVKSMGGFFEGGFTGLGNPHDPAGVVHKGEYVVNHKDLAAAGGPGAVESMMRSLRNPSQSTPAVPGLNASNIGVTTQAVAAGKADESWVKPARDVYIDYRSHDLVDRAIADPRFKSRIIQIGRGNTGDFGSPT